MASKQFHSASRSMEVEQRSVIPLGSLNPGVPRGPSTEHSVATVAAGAIEELDRFCWWITVATWDGHR